jgi:hypothetical protein
MPFIPNPKHIRILQVMMLEQKVHVPVRGGAMRNKST